MAFVLVEQCEHPGLSSLEGSDLEGERVVSDKHVLALRVNFRKRTHSDIRLEFFLMAASGLSCSSWTLVA